MADDSNDEQRHQVYLTETEFVGKTFDYQRKYFRKDHPHALLLYAKAYFIKQKYEDCIDILQKIQKKYSTKVLFERQALMFKACYLKDPQDTNTLNRIIQQYQTNKNRCPGKTLTSFHHNQIKQLQEVVLKGQQLQKKNGSLKKQQKQQIKNQIRPEQKKTRYQGFPSYLISTNWNKKFNEFLLRDGAFPGPITNFQLINHVFQLEPHQENSKSYMDKLLFPMVEEKRYFALRKSHWHFIEKMFSGIEVKRIFVTSPVSRQLNGGDNLIKTVINCRQDRYIMQWQSGTFWQHSILPSLRQKFGCGQLKQQKSTKQYIILQPGRADQPYNPLIYVKIDQNIISAMTPVQEKRRQKIFLYYDLQKYNPDDIKKKGTLGLLNLGNTCYMNSALQFLCNLKLFSEYFVTNKYLEKVNITDKNKEGSYGTVLCAFGDLVKRMWFNHPDLRYIDPNNFKRVFGQRYPIFVGNQQQDAQQFLMFLLSCLHQDVNQNAQSTLMHRQSMGGKSFETVRSISLSHYKKHNKSIISDLFHGFLFEQIMCDDCKFKTYRFQYFLMLHVQAPPEAPKLTVYVVENKKYQEAKKVQVYTSKMEKIGDIVKVIREYFGVSSDNSMLGFLYFDDEKLWEPVTEQKDIATIMRATNYKQASFFLHQIPPLQPDQQIAMLSYYYESPTKIEVDGFPRFLPIKKEYQQEGYVTKLQELVFQTIPERKLIRSRKDYLKQVKIKKINGKQYSVNYRVIFQLKVANYQNNGVNRILGESVSNEGTNLDSCLARLSKQQVVDQYKCEKCNQIRSAHKTDHIYSTSKYLIIQIKRFTESGKICTKVDYPINNLNMKKFLYKDEQGGPPQAQPKQNENEEYDLQGVILHRGSLNSGHYTCIQRNRDKSGWLYFDDESVRELDEESVVDANAYILLYQKKGKEEDFMLTSKKYQRLGLSNNR